MVGTTFVIPKDGLTVLQAINEMAKNMWNDSEASDTEYGGVIFYNSKTGNIELNYWKGKNTNSMGNVIETNTLEMIKEGKLSYLKIIGFIHTHQSKTKGNNYFSFGDYHWTMTFSGGKRNGTPGIDFVSSESNFSDALVTNGTFIFVIGHNSIYEMKINNANKLWFDWPIIEDNLKSMKNGLSDKNWMLKANEIFKGYVTFKYYERKKIWGNK